MIKSMTGFGTMQCKCESKTYNIDIKAVNSKNLDIVQKLPAEFKEKEMDVRSIVGNFLLRGKVEVSITSETQQNSSLVFDESEMERHFDYLKTWVNNKHLNVSDADILKLTFKMPDIFVHANDEILSAEDWQIVNKAIENACNMLNANRDTEGSALEQDFRLRISLIEQYLQNIEVIENNRHDLIKSKLLKQLSALDFEYDKNRFEQELIFYLEKFDFTEEKIRLKQHCSYFIDTLSSTTEVQAGKKLTFISQEMGREINTLGSKSSDADIQKLVVQMKDELEKIKEQLANVL